MRKLRKHGSVRGLATTDGARHPARDHVVSACGEAYRYESIMGGVKTSSGEAGLLDDPFYSTRKGADPF